MILRLARSTDAAAIAAIYAPVVRDTTISFETEPPDANEMAVRIARVLPSYPWLVAEENGRVLGYAYAGAHRSRAAYQWSVEPSVYVSAEARRTGVGRRLYTALFAVLQAQGFVRAYAGVTLPNAPSEGFHRTFGFEDVGVYRGVGYKHGAWHDVWWGALDLSSARDDPPPPTRSIPELEEAGELARILSAS